MAIEHPAPGLRIGIVTDGAVERQVASETRIANGGVGVYIYQLVRHLLELDRNNKFFLIRDGRGRLDIYQHPRAQPVFLSRVRPKHLRSLLGPTHRTVVRSLRLDLLHYPNQFGGAFLPASVPRVATLHDLTPLLFPTMHPYSRVLAYWLMARLSLRRSTRVIVDSENTRRDLLARELAAPGAVVTIFPGVSAVYSPGEPDPTFLAQHHLARPYMLTVGVLEPRKNHELLLKVLKRLNLNGRQLDLIIIGREGWRWRDPLSRPEYAQLKSRVRILRDLPEAAMVEYYRHAQVFAYPSFYEGFGLPVLEAMACGTAVVSSNSSSLPEVAGAAALYADPRDERAFAAQVARVLDDRVLRERMRSQGLARAQELSWRRTALATLEVYRSVCPQARRTDRGACRTLS